MSSQDTVTVYTDELPEIPPPIIDINFPARVTIRGVLSVIRNIKNVLSEEYLTEFRRWPQLGRLIDLPSTGNFSGALVHQLLLKRIDCKKNQELWFSLNGKPARFSLNEFVLITGLYAAKLPSEKKGNDLLRENRLMIEHWPGRKSVTVSHVYATLRALRNTETEDRVKLAFVYLVAGFLLARDPEMPVPSWVLCYADDLEFFNSFSWGKICYRYLIEELSGVNLEEKYRAKKNRKDVIEYTILACPWILQVWAYEAIPRLGEILAIIDPENIKPRWLSWRTKEIHDAKVTKFFISTLDSAECSVRPTLQPSLDEKRQTYYERLRTLKDDDDHVIDCLTGFLSRDIILSSRNLSSERGDIETQDENDLNIWTQLQHGRDLTLKEIIEKSNPKRPVRDSTPMQRVEKSDSTQPVSDSTPIQSEESSNPKEPVSDLTPMQIAEDSTLIQRVENSNSEQHVSELTPMQRDGDSTPSQIVEMSNPQQPVRDSTLMQRIEISDPKQPVRDSTLIRSEESSNPKEPVSDSTSIRIEEDSTLIPEVGNWNPERPVSDLTAMQRADDSNPSQKVEKSNPKQPMRDLTPMQRVEDSTPMQIEEDLPLIQRVENSNPERPMSDLTPMQRDDDSTPSQRVENSNPKQPMRDSTPIQREEKSDPTQPVSDSTLIRSEESSNPKEPVSGSTSMQIEEDSSLIQRVENSNPKEPMSTSTPMQIVEDPSLIQRVENSNPEQPVSDLTPMQREENSDPKKPLLDSTPVQGAEDSIPIQRPKKSNLKKRPSRNSSEKTSATKVIQLQHLKKHLDRSLEKQERTFRSILDEQNSSNELRIQALSSDISELKESHKMVMGRLDQLIDMFYPRKSQMGEQQEILMLENGFDQVHSHHCPNGEQEESSNSEEGIDDPDRETYLTPNTILYDIREEVELGDEVTSVILRGREVRIRKRPRNSNKKIRHVKSDPPIFDPFREADLEQVQAFQRWLGCETNGVAAIRCGIASRRKQFFNAMISPQSYISSEHVDEVLYLFRKRIQTFRDSFPKDICILTHDFSEIVTSLYKECERIKRTRSQKLKYPFTEELLKFTRGERPRRGRLWSSKVNTFYVPWNHNKGHWIMLVVVVSEWAIWVYDSVPSHWSSINQLKKELRPFCEYFSFLIEKSRKFRSQEKNFGTPLVVRVPPNSNVPRNIRTGDCGVYMLKTMEMHMADICDENATTLLNDNNIQEVRESYALQLYFNNASI